MPEGGFNLKLSISLLGKELEMNQRYWECGELPETLQSAIADFVEQNVKQALSGDWDDTVPSCYFAVLNGKATEVAFPARSLPVPCLFRSVPACGTSGTPMAMVKRLAACGNAWRNA